MTINGTVQLSKTLTPTIGGSATAVINATGADGITVTTYMVAVEREALLADIKLSTGSLTPAFEGGTLNYSVYLPNTVKSVTLTPQKSPSCTSFTINGKNVAKIVLKPAAGGSATATIRAVGTGASITQTYSVTVYRIAPITSIGLSSGKLSPAFSISKGTYTVSLNSSASSVTITPVRGASCAELLIDGVPATSKTLYPAIGGSASTTIRATAVDGQHYTYIVTVNRLAMLKGITVSTGSYSPAFSVTTFSYSMTVPATTASVKVTPSKGPGAKTMKINSKTASNVTLKPVIGGSATASIVLTTAGGTTQTYTVTVHRLPLLTGIGTSAGALSPAFNPAVTGYAVNLPADTTSTTLTASLASSGVQGVTMNGTAVSTLPVTVSAPGGTSTVTIVATASDGTTKATYIVAVKRDPVISGITVTNGSLSPAFSPIIGNYTINVPATTSTVTLTPVRGAACVETEINGIPAASMSISLPVGGSRTIPVSGRTALGLVSTYNVTISRAALVTRIRTSTATYPVNPAFSATTLSYTVTIPASRASITVFATKAAKGVKALTMNGHKATSLLVKPALGASVTVTIVATASDGITTVTYVVTVHRLAV
jgi:hypothetical protein